MTILGAPLEFFLFGLTLAGVAVLHRQALPVALGGMVVIAVYKLLGPGFHEGAGPAGLLAHVRGEWVLLANLFLLILGFAVLSNQFELSRAPDAMPALLPDNWTGGLALLGMVFALSTVLDNIAGAVIGGVIARHVYRGQVSIGFLAAIVAASNAGGAGSVIGDTTTTMMWIGGVPPLEVASAFVASAVAFAVFGVAGALQQHRFAPITAHRPPGLKVDVSRLVLVVVLLLALVGTNLGVSLHAPELEHRLPALGLGLWAAILATALWRRPDWGVLGPAVKGALFLAALVAAASMMPVENLPDPSWRTVFGLGGLSAVFDNIPLTALALAQGGYDWALLAYAVGFGGSMIWFGSSAGVALTNLYPQGRSVTAWLRGGWHVPLAYVAGFAVLLALRGWSP